MSKIDNLVDMDVKKKSWIDVRGDFHFNVTNLAGLVICVMGIRHEVDWKVILIGAVLIFGKGIAEKIIDAWSKKA